MPLTILKVTPKAVRVRIEISNPPSTHDWTVDRRQFGSIGSIVAHNEDGGRCTIGNFRTRDGSQMQPDYAKLRKLLQAA